MKTKTPSGRKSTPALKPEDQLYSDLRNLYTKMHCRVVRRMHRSSILELFYTRHRLETITSAEKEAERETGKEPNFYQQEHLFLLACAKCILEVKMENEKKEGAA